MLADRSRHPLPPVRVSGGDRTEPVRRATGHDDPLMHRLGAVRGHLAARQTPSQPVQTSHDLGDAAVALAAGVLTVAHARRLGDVRLLAAASMAIAGVVALAPSGKQA